MRHSWDLMQALYLVDLSTTLARVRVLVTILARLAWHQQETSTANSVREELVIFVRKQVQASRLQFRRQGVVAAVVLVSAMVRAADTEFPLAESTVNSSAGLPAGRGPDSEAEELMNFVMVNTKNCEEVAGLFLDEMSNMVDSNVPDWFIDSLVDKLTDEFEKNYFETSNEENSHESTLPTKVEFVIESGESDTEEDLCHLNLATQLMRVGGKFGGTVESRRQHSSSLARMVPLFRMITKLLLAKSGCASQDDKLEKLNIMSICGIEMFTIFEPENLSQFSEENKNLILSGLFYAQNFLTEIVNSFCHQENDEEKNSVMIRFKQIYELRKTIIDFSKKHPQYRPPEMLFGEDTSEWAPAISTDDKAKNKGGKKGGAGKKSSRRKEAESQQVGRSLVAVSQAGPGGQTNTTTQQAGAGRESGGSIAHFRPFLREFDLDCLLAVLSHKSLTIEEEAEGTRFRPEEYLFVMEDLLSKLQHKVGTMKKKFPGKKFSISSFGFTNLSLIPASKVVLLVSDHLEHILAALDQIFSHVKRLIANEDGVIDGLGMQSCGALLLQKCLLVSFQTLYTLFSWTGFKSSSNTNALKMSLLRIARRGSGDIASGADISSLAGAAVTHLIRFREIINTVDVAAAQIFLVATLDSIDSSSSVE